MSINRTSTPILIWAIDPFEGKVRPHPLEVENWVTWAKEIGAEIQPVYVLNLPPIKDTGGEQIQFTIHEKARIGKAIRDYLQDLGSQKNLVPEILVSYDSSAVATVEKLLKFSSQTGALGIMVSSRGRKGFDRFLFGSFSENLLFQSPIPIIFMTHQHTPFAQTSQKTVLFPTDLSSNSLKTFEKLLPQALKWGAKIVLYYAVSLPIHLITTEGLIMPDNFISDQITWGKTELQNWVEKARLMGIAAEVVVENVGIASNIAPAIIDQAKKQSVKFISMASNSGKLNSVFFGSVARDVFRTNLFSVMACGPMVFKRPEKQIPTFAVTTLV